MKNINKILLLITVVVFVATVFTQCASQQKATSSTDNASKGTPEYVLQKSGAQLWAESCIRCHNTASPATFSDTQWDVALKHMEIRAQLTKVEAEKILEFIQSAN
ncbi:MAG: hypothetical protein R8N23_19880 [Reichenbachiella sp.]|uniref:hypothetical protein n=1 Tax=Reichenbachiella sp. TaxID=2184521 RepID=UPI002965D60E|nr:hypothetical protein [Reichenbachiella sp.]MDW3212139.1 hypothetical protein [Reichenbachiella sp.]